MNLYTVIVEFRGGTYTSQVFAESIDEVISEWYRKVNYKDIYGLGKKHIIDCKMISLLREKNQLQ